MIEVFSPSMPELFGPRRAVGDGRGFAHQRIDFTRDFERLRKRDPQHEMRRWLRDRNRYLTTDKIAYDTYTAMTVTNLQSLAIDTADPYAGWQSARVSNLSTLADDYEIVINLSTAATAPANDKAIYVYLVPWVSTDGGSTWLTGANFSTTTRPTGSEATASMSDANSMKGPLAIPYKITSQPLDLWFTVGQLCGPVMPDGWSLAIRNNCGAALGVGCVVAYRAITWTNN